MEKILRGKFCVKLKKNKNFNSKYSEKRDLFVSSYKNIWKKQLKI